MVEYSFDSGTTWSTSFVPPTQGAVSVEVRQRDLAGNQGSASTAFAYTYDTLAPVIPGITGLTTDTGSSSTDKVTSIPALTLTGTEATAVVEYSFDGGTTWNTSNVPPTQGAVSVEARQRDLAGNQGSASSAFAYTYTYNSVRPTVTVYSLSPDTGSSATNQVTNNTSPTLTFTFSEPVYGTNANVTVTNAALTPITPTSVTGWGTATLSMTFTTLPDSVYTVTLDGSSAAPIKDLAGNVINGNQGNGNHVVTFQVNTVAPAIPGITGLTTDTGSSSTDLLTSNPALTVTGTEANAVVEYSFNGGTTWSTSFVPPTQGAVSVEVRQRDLAGNQGSASTAFAYTYDSLVPAIPAITGLTADTGGSSINKVTSNPALTVTGTEVNAVVEYSFNGGTTWSTSNVPPTQGVVAVEVRQRDLAGNQGSASAAFAFTFDTVRPAVTAYSLSPDTGSSSTNQVTSNRSPTLTFTFGEPVYGAASNVTVTNAASAPITPTSVTGWGTSTLIMTFTTLPEQCLHRHAGRVIGHPDQGFGRERHQWQPGQRQPRGDLPGRDARPGHPGNRRSDHRHR